MKVALLRVGIDTGCGGMDGPLFADGSFEYVPIPDSSGLDERTYGNQTAPDGRPWVTFFPLQRQSAMQAQSVHLDPEFTTFTYGDPTTPKAGLRHLECGDLLVFYAGLRGFDHVTPPALYLIGYFEVDFAGYAKNFTPSQLADCQANFHVRHEAILRKQLESLVLVKGGPSSRRLTRAVKISATGQDRTGKPLKILSPEMQIIFGSFNGKLSFQRSPTRWVAPEFAASAAVFVRGL